MPEYIHNKIQPSPLHNSFYFFEIDAVCLFFVFFVQTFIFYKSMEEGIDQKSIQSSTTPELGHH